MHQHVAYAEVFGELARGPVRRAVGGLAAGSGEDASLHRRSQNLGYLPQMTRVQTRKRVFEETLLPARHIGGTATQSLDDRVKGFAVGEHQDQPRFPRIIGPAAARPNPQFERFANLSGEDHLWRGRHAA